VINKREPNLYKIGGLYITYLRVESYVTQLLIFTNYSQGISSLSMNLFVVYLTKTLAAQIKYRRVSGTVSYNLERLRNKVVVASSQILSRQRVRPR
jgi:hypothetical protein